ncbi:unnamed protein product [Effrenium voratum]|nr:unnamed protein product [Effrenium voratum]
MKEDAVAEIYESPQSATLAVTILSLSFSGLFLAGAVVAKSCWEFLGVLLWPSCLLWLNLCVLVPQCSVQVRRICTGLGCLALFLFPLMDFCRSGVGLLICASESAAAILVTARALQLLAKLEAESSERWGRWRRFYHMACLSWHDVDRVRALESTEHSSHYRSVGSELVCALLGLLACSWAVHLLPTLPSTGLARLLVLCFGAGCVVFGFYTFDRFYLFLLSYFNKLGVSSIFGPQLWQARTVKEFWRQWNLPVQRMLSQAVFRPLVRFGMSPDLSGLVVFAVSGLGHAWPLVCVGAGNLQVAMMILFFVSQVVPLKLEAVLRIQSRLWVYAVEILMSPLFVATFLVFFDGSSAVESTRSEVLDISRAVRLVTQSLFPSFQIAVRPLANAPHTRRRIMAGYLAHHDDTSTTSVLYCELQPQQGEQATSGRLVMYDNENCQDSLSEVILSPRTVCTEKIGISCTCFTVDQHLFSARTIAERKLWLRALSNIKVKLQNGAPEPDDEGLRQYRVAILEHARTTGCNDSQAVMDALLQRHVRKAEFPEMPFGYNQDGFFAAPMQPDTQALGALGLPAVMPVPQGRGRVALRPYPEKGSLLRSFYFLPFRMKRPRSKHLHRAKRKLAKNSSAPSADLPEDGEAVGNFGAIITEGLQRFEEHYRPLGLARDEEWAKLAHSLRQPLPLAFRLKSPDAVPELQRFREELREGCTTARSRFVPAPRFFGFSQAVSLGCDAKTLRQEQWEAPGSALGRLARWLAESQAKGLVSRQEVVSTVPVALLEVQPGHVVLDMCAAPGSKTLQALQALELGRQLHARQLQIALRAAALLKPGGVMSYSTCSFNPLENEAVVAALLERTHGALELQAAPQLSGLPVRPGLRTWTVEDLAGVPKRERRRFRCSMWPPAASKFPLERCVRCLPFLANTGGFFVALLKKVKPWPGAPQAAASAPGASGLGEFLEMPPEVAVAQFLDGFTGAEVLRMQQAEGITEITEPGATTRQLVAQDLSESSKWRWLRRGHRKLFHCSDTLVSVLSTPRPRALALVSAGLCAFSRPRASATFRVTAAGGELLQLRREANAAAKRKVPLPEK